MTIPNDELEFLKQSNWIEGEYSNEALDDAVQAWQYIKNKGNPMFSYESIMHTHYLLMHRLRPDIAGKLRDCAVWVGRHYRPFISQALLKEEIQGVCMSIIVSAARFQYAGDVETAIASEEPITRKLHVKFEHCHPYVDGNGRTGRILMNAHRVRLGIPLLVIKETEKHDYYQWF